MLGLDERKLTTTGYCPCVWSNSHIYWGASWRKCHFMILYPSLGVLEGTIHHLYHWEFPHKPSQGLCKLLSCKSWSSFIVDVLDAQIILEKQESGVEIPQPLRFQWVSHFQISFSLNLAPRIRWGKYSQMTYALPGPRDSLSIRTPTSHQHYA